jgi:hypothetical protein
MLIADDHDITTTIVNYSLQELVALLEARRTRHLQVTCGI